MGSTIVEFINESSHVRNGLSRAYALFTRHLLDRHPVEGPSWSQWSECAAAVEETFQGFDFSDVEHMALYKHALSSDGIAPIYTLLLVVHTKLQMAANIDTIIDAARAQSISGFTADASDVIRFRDIQRTELINIVLPLLRNKHTAYVSESGEWARRVFRV